MSVKHFYVAEMNHEVQAVNHEMQAVNHDTEAVNHDTQAVNHEMQAVNHEMQAVCGTRSAFLLVCSRTVRTWNLLTSLAPSVSAWLDPANQLNTSIKRLEKRSLVRKSATVCAAMVVALETLMSQPEMARKLWGGKMHKFDILTDLSK